MIAVAALAVLAAALIAVVVNQRGSAREDELALAARFSRTNLALPDLQKERDQLAARLEALQGGPVSEGGGLPSAEAVQVLSAALTDYFSQRELRVASFARVDVPADEEVRVPSVSYEISAQGVVNSLIGVLSLLNEYPSVVVRTLEFRRALVEPEWTMDLGMAVHYSPGSGGGQ